GLLSSASRRRRTFAVGLTRSVASQTLTLLSQLLAASRRPSGLQMTFGLKPGSHVRGGAPPRISTCCPEKTSPTVTWSRSTAASRRPSGLNPASPGPRTAPRSRLAPRARCPVRSWTVTCPVASRTASAPSSGLNVRARTTSGVTVSAWTSRPSAASRTRTRTAVSRGLPSGPFSQEQSSKAARERPARTATPPRILRGKGGTPPGWNELRGRPVAASQTFTSRRRLVCFQSVASETTRWPSRLPATRTTGNVCPLRRRSSAPEATSQTATPGRSASTAPGRRASAPPGQIRPPAEDSRRGTGDQPLPREGALVFQPRRAGGGVAHLQLPAAAHQRQPARVVQGQRLDLDVRVALGRGEVARLVGQVPDLDVPGLLAPPKPAAGRSGGSRRNLPGPCARGAPAPRGRAGCPTHARCRPHPPPRPSGRPGQKPGPEPCWAG